MATSQYMIHLDRRVELTGVFAAGVTTWTLPFTDTTINCIVPGFTANDAVDGVPVTPTTSPGATITKTGNYSGGVCTLGRTYQAQMELSRPYIRDQQGQTVIGPRLLVRTIQVFYRRAGAFSVRLDRVSPVVDISRTFVPASGLVTNNDIFQVYLPGNPDREKWFIEDTGPKPMIVTSLVWIGDVGDVQR